MGERLRQFIKPRELPIEKELTPASYRFDVLIIGAGSGGIGTAVALLKHSEISGITPNIGLIDSNGIGGTLGKNSISANSPTNDFLDGIDGPFTGILYSTSARRLRRSPGTTPQLADVGAFIRETGLRVARLLPKHAVLQNTVAAIQWDGETYKAVDKKGTTITTAANIVFATGAHEWPRVHIGEPLCPYKEKLVVSGEILRNEKIATIREQLLTLPFENRVGAITIVGNSHSAWASVHKLLETLGDILPVGAITVIFRHETKLFFNSVDEARIAGYFIHNPSPKQQAVQQTMTCPVTGRVNRFGGIRQPYRDVYERVINGQERRITLKQTENLLEANAELAKAQIIIQAFGLSTNIIPIFDKDWNLIGPFTDTAGTVLMTQQAQICTFDHKPLPGTFGNGIGYAGIFPTTQIGGEPIFKGSLYGDNVSRTLVAPMIVDQILTL